MINFEISYDEGSKQHTVTATDGKKPVMSASISEYKLGERNTTEVIQCALKTVSKLLNELNSEETTDE